METVWVGVSAGENIVQTREMGSVEEINLKQKYGIL
jgi:hypothetical protein